jgi:N6-adenosine-specific RNA methylase IME4
LTPTRPVSAIQVGQRHRRDLGDVDQLAASIAELGLLHPVVIKPDGMLIAGERRLDACKKLGWADVPVTVVDLADIVRGEFAENAHRKDFLPSEIDAIRRALEPLEKAAAKKRQLAGRAPSGNFPEGGEVRDKIGSFAGVSGKTVQKIARVIQAAEAEPERFGHLVQEMDGRAGGVHSAYRKLCQARDETQILSLKPVAGKFRTLVVDPPWQYTDDLMGRGPPEYSTMTHDDLLALPVASWAESQSHLYLWVTNAFIPRGVELLAHWGFEHNTALTWAKPRFGMGANFRGQTEHVLFGIRGELGTRRKDISTLFEAPLGAHSEKPEKFYEIVHAASYPPYGEAFQRKARPGFVNLFTEKQTEAAE